MNGHAAVIENTLGVSHRIEQYYTLIQIDTTIISHFKFNFFYNIYCLLKTLTFNCYYILFAIAVSWFVNCLE